MYKNLRRKLFTVFQFSFFLIVGLLLFWWLYREHDARSILDSLKDFKLEWIFLSFFWALCSHFLRALRWQMLLRSLSYQPKIKNVFLSILVMYLANNALPRLGEVARCGILKNYEGIPVSKQLGTVVTERMTDLLVLALLSLIVISAQWDVLSQIWKGNPNIDASIAAILQSRIILIVIAASLIVLLILGWINKGKLMKFKLLAKFGIWLQQVKEGIMSILRIKYPFRYLLLSVLIYLMYLLMTYSVFKAYDPTMGFGWGVGLAVLVMGSIGMVFPVQGGIGTYHFFVIQTLLVFGMTDHPAQLFALVLHGSMTLFMILAGVFSLIALPLVNRAQISN